MISSVCFGLFLGRNVSPSDVKEAIDEALKNGYRYFDTAQVYGTEECLGDCLHEAFEKQELSRNDVIVCTKLGSINMKDEETAILSVSESLKKLQLGYVDLLLMHMPVALIPNESGEGLPKDSSGQLMVDDNVDYVNVWKALEKCLHLGLTKHIGVSNFSVHQLERLLDNCITRPENVQVEISPYFANIQLVEFCYKQGISISAYSVFQGSSKGGDEGYPSIFSDPVIDRIAKKHNKTPAQCTLKFLLQRGIAPICRSVKPAKIEENAPKNLQFELDEGDIADMLALNKDERYVKLAAFNVSKNYPF